MGVLETDPASPSKVDAVGVKSDESDERDEAWTQAARPNRLVAFLRDLRVSA